MWGKSHAHLHSAFAIVLLPLVTHVVEVLILHLPSPLVVEFPLHELFHGPFFPFGGTREAFVISHILNNPCVIMVQGGKKCRVSPHAPSSTMGGESPNPIGSHPKSGQWGEYKATAPGSSLRPHNATGNFQYHWSNEVSVSLKNSRTQLRF